MYVPPVQNVYKQKTPQGKAVVLNAKKLPDNVCASFIPCPTPIDCLWVGAN